MMQYKIVDASEEMLRLSKGVFDIATSVSKIKPISAQATTDKQETVFG